MKICPKCKNEYRDGITHCADCGCELLDELKLKDEKKLLLEEEYPIIKEAVEYLEYCKFETIYMDETDENGVVRLYCEKKEFAEASKQIQAFSYVKTQNALEENFAHKTEKDIEEMAEEAVSEVLPSNVYQNYEDKAEDHRSSAYSFLIIGSIGLAVVILSWFDLIPFSFGGTGNIFTHGILFAFFVIFIFVGIVSAKNVGKYKELATKEASDLNELEKFLAEKLTYVVLSEITAETEEEAYFKRMTYMREQVLEAFPEMSQNKSFVEVHLDEHYDKLFG